MEKLSIVTLRLGKLLNMEALMPVNVTSPSTYSLATSLTTLVSTLEFNAICRTMMITAQMPKIVQSAGRSQRRAPFLTTSFPIIYKYSYN